jgi:hypothetical protein
MLSPTVCDVLQETPSVAGGCSRTLDDPETTLAEGTYAFTAIKTGPARRQGPDPARGGRPRPPPFCGSPA